jgi:hypothetical protein
MTTYDALAGLPLEVEGYELEALQKDVSSDFTRRTTVVRLRGGGLEGVGEDVTYDANEHELLQQAGAVHDFAGRHTFDSFSELLGSFDLFPSGAPKFPEWRLYRRWAFESAALDLALRQAGRSLSDALGRAAGPVRFVVSLRLGEPASVGPVRRRLDLYPEMRFKLDPTSSWTPALVDQLAGLGCVDIVDLKGAYRGTIVDQPADPELYRLVAEGFPEAWIEDPDLTDRDTAGALEPYRDRITWDAPIHSVEDIETLPFLPRTINVKPSRVGSVGKLLELYDHCAGRGIGAYGGGQFELGPGRGQIQHLASIFHHDAPNDVAPVGYHDPQPRPGLPTSPLASPTGVAGFR